MGSTVFEKKPSSNYHLRNTRMWNPKTRLYEKSPRRIPAAQTAGPMYEVLIYDNNQTQSGV